MSTPAEGLDLGAIRARAEAFNDGTERTWTAAIALAVRTPALVAEVERLREVAEQAAAKALREAADEVEGNIAEALAERTPDNDSNRARKRSQAKGHRMSASLSVAKWLRERAQGIEGGE